MKRLGIALLFVAACGGGGDGDSGVDGDKNLTELSDSEQQALCEHVLELQGGAGATIECGDFDVEIDTVAECVTGLGEIQASCAATVDDAEACAAGQGEDPCDFTNPPAACEVVFGCFAGG
jgi:hypothetical protein